MSVLSVFVILFILAVLPFAVVSWRDHRLVIAGYYFTIITRIVLAAGHSLGGVSGLARS